MSNPDMHNEDFDEGTSVKLKIFKQYLNEWLPVFPKSGSKRIQICDYFAGPGHDASGNPGSPMIALAALKDHRDTIGSAGTVVRFRLNDVSKGNIDKLSRAVEAEITANSLNGLVIPNISCADFSHIFDQEAEVIRRTGTPSFIFLDQYGVKYVNPAVFTRLCQLPKTDFLFFISSSHLKRFCQEEEFLKHHPDLDQESIKACNNDHIHREICKYYRSMVPSGNQTRVYPFTIKKGGNVYGLIFCTSHPLGAEKFINVAWVENDVNGEANFDLDEDDQKNQLTIFEGKRPTKIESFNRRLRDRILDGTLKTNEDAYWMCLEEGMRPSIGKLVIKEMINAQELRGSKTFGMTYDSVIKERKIVTFSR